MGALEITDIIIACTVGGLFTLMACLKFYGLLCGIQGGAGKPLVQRLVGS